MSKGIESIIKKLPTVRSPRSEVSLANSIKLLKFFKEEFFLILLKVLYTCKLKARVTLLPNL